MRISPLGVANKTSFESVLMMFAAVMPEAALF
jgi:hypothetical protein